MDLDLSSVALGPPIITCTIEGIVEVEDLHELIRPAGEDGSSQAASPPEALPDPSDMSRVREKWHSVARLVASGMTTQLVASISGYTPTYLSILLNNPAMQEMVGMYRTQQGSAAAVIAERLRTVGMEALDSVAADLAGGRLTAQDKLGLAKLGLDRSGHGPTSTQHVVTENHLVDHARLEELNNSARAGSKERIIPLQARRALPAPEQESDS